MNISQRFVFPGFSMVRQEDSSTHEVEIGKISMGDEVFIVHMIRKVGLSFGGSFLVAKIFDQTGSNLLWDFRNAFFDGLGLLAKAGDEIVVAFVGKGADGFVEGVIPLSSIAKHVPADLRRRVQLKKLAAEFLEREYRLTAAERVIMKHDTVLQKEKERAAREASHEARLRARIELVAQITKRGTVEAYTFDGRRRFGHPVVGEEWSSLSNGTYVVLVESYDKGKMGKPIEAFQVVKEKGKNPEKGFPAPVTWERRVNEQGAAENIPQPVKAIIIETEKGEAFEVAVYATMDAIRQARVAGLNRGAYVAAEDKKVGLRYEVLSIKGDGIKTVGHFTPIA